ncbi:hypothetical protein GQ53DRAFT_782878 [Thozetella sp. PMI_491]|nr:hypothetical protein GQ53DRAFT_782878 [Thozetella sp. PMI_491]
MAALRDPVVSLTTSALSFDASSLTQDARHKLEEYRKIVQLRDEVLSGAHPRIKATPVKPGIDDVSLPSSNAVSLVSAPSRAQGTKVNGHAAADNSRSYQANAQRASVAVPANVPGLGMLSGHHAPDAPKSFVASKPAINPVLLEKSDDLIKAEIQLQRQRLERGLKDQIDQKRAAAKASQQAPEQVSDLNLAEVLSKALMLVQTTATKPTDETAANPSNESDSFDDNTFYSSRHDTPETPQVSRIPNEVEVEDEEMREDSYEPQLDSPPLGPVPNPLAAEPPSPTRAAPSSLNSSIRQLANPASGLGGTVGHYNTIATSAANNRAGALQVGLPIEITSSDGSAPASRSEESGNTGVESAANQGNLFRINHNLLGQALSRQDSPVVRAHNLSPIAPQPEHVSPLAVSRQPPLAQGDASARQATPAQVAALRQQASAGTTPESSPQGSRNERKKKKKKKRAERQAAEAATQSPCIKPEPRSPSPLNAPPFSRPHKRQRPNHSQQPSLSYDEPGSAGGGRRPRHNLQGSTREEQGSNNGASADLRSRDAPQTIYLDEPRYDGGYSVDPKHSYGSAQGQGPPFPPYGQEPRPVREAPLYSYDQRDGPRMGALPGAVRERSRSPRYDRSAVSLSSTRAPTRIVIDEFGREYMEPSRPPAVIRETVVSSSRVGEPELRYERIPPPGAAPPRPDTFEQDGVLYRRVSPSYASAPRRVITQPETVAPDYRSYHEREFSARPMLPPGEEYGAPRPRVVTAPREYITRAASVRPPEGVRYETTVGYERRPLDEPFSEYMPTRPASVRPAEGIRYEVPVGYERRVVDEPVREYGSLRASSVRPAGYEVVRDYGVRYGSVRPELHREYAASVHPEQGREAMHPPAEARSYSVRPYDGGQAPQVVRQEFRPVEQYYTRPPPRQDEEVVYLERPPQGSYH